MKNMFWGILLVALGVLLIVQHVFGINIPVFKILFGLALIYFGLKLIFGSFGHSFKRVKTETTAVFTEATLVYPSTNGEKDYNAIFGNASLDLSQVVVQDKDVRLEANAVFGNLKILLPKNQPYVVKSTTVFGKVNFDGANKIYFGEYQTQNVHAQNAPFHLSIEANSVFGSIVIEEK